jgi:signal transduction histidine kinase/cellulose synthase/poly-beta-1,6-N-acetylglucosamine synthase-like glycosyltransferase/CheY-like chemotaxis protein/HAMP domain-containing protein
VTTTFQVISIITIAYFVALNVIYLSFTAVAWRGITSHLHGRAYAGVDEAFASTLAPPISILLPGYNEEAGIVESVRSLLSLRYPEFEVLVINDGSTDATLHRLDDAFELVPIHKALREAVSTAPVHGTYIARRHPELIVIDKAHHGKADALNAGLNAARHRYVCAVDADAILEPDALLRVAKPILDDPELVAATGGIVRIVNGCRVEHGHVVEVGLPSSRLATLQIIEYFRAFLVGRMGWSSIGSLIIISGAFGLFRRSVVEAVGGWWTGTVGEDVELVVRIHRYLREQGEPYSIVFVPDPVCWTEVPEDLGTLSRQRRRWQRGLGEALWRHRSVLCRPRYGVLGLLAFPYFLVFELLGPVIEAIGVPVVLLAVLIGRISYTFLAALLVVSVLLGALLSIAALALEEFSFRRHRHRGDIQRMLVFSIAENFGYRQLVTAWRFLALVDLLRGKREWGLQKRLGLVRTTSSPTAEAVAKMWRPEHFPYPDSAASISRSRPFTPSVFTPSISDVSRHAMEVSMQDPVKSLTETVDAKVLLSVLTQMKEGDFSARMPIDWTGMAGKAADSLNEVIADSQALGTELARVSHIVGKEGRLLQRASLAGSSRSWSGSIESVNSLIDDLVRPTTEMQRVIGAVADGDLSKKVSTVVRGDLLELKDTINSMVDQLNGFIADVTRVTREVGTEGKLGQAAAVNIGVGGVWKELTDNVNLMAGNLTGQVRNIAEVTTAVANGDLSKKISIDVTGEFLELKNTVNAMVDQLNSFAGEVTRVAREVGVEGKLGGQAQSKEVGGVWKDLTDNVNQLAANLTNQVRAISEVATAVTAGDLTRQVSVEASGEVAVLKDKLNEMIRNLRETTRQNVEQDWLKTSRERFTRMLQGQSDLTAVSSMILCELATLVSAQHGVFYSTTSTSEADEQILQLQAGYGYQERRHLSTSFRLGEGLVGQCAKEKKRILLTDVPSDYVRINSGLGESPPLNIVVLPVLFEGSLRAVIELASFSSFSVAHQTFLDSITESIGIVLNTIAVAARTETLLKQSQSLAEELRTQQEELRGSYEDLGHQAGLLAEQNVEAERKNREVEESKRLVEEKVNQLADSSKYKSEFIANMSHELRTPLNSLLILAEQLQDDPGHTMTDTQVQYAGAVLSSGRDLLSLLNNILELAKAESGTVKAELVYVSVDALRTTLLREFEHIAASKGLHYRVDVAPDVPHEILTDPQRLGQILTNFLGNAFKFTSRGEVRVQVSAVDRGWNTEIKPLVTSGKVISFSVSDTGIGIGEDDHERIFQPFAQGSGTTARNYGGTGLGLSISRELVDLLGGEITVASSPGMGSTFTVYVPCGPPAIPSLGKAPPVIDATDGPPIALQAPPPREPVAGADSTQVASVNGRPGYERAPSTRRRAPTALDERPFEDKKVLVVDDDFRNVFALTALLERGHATVIPAESGRDAIAALERNPDIDLVLMDIMMPVMDGYEAIRAIRSLDGFKSLPILAITAKVVPGERERCLEAGANDYVPKPVDTGQLLASIGPWLPLNSGSPR